MAIIATIAQYLGSAELIPINISVTAERLVPDLVSYTLTATLSEAATEAVSATVQVQNSNGVGGNWNPQPSFSIGETIDIITFDETLSGTIASNNQAFTITVIQHPSFDPTPGYELNILTPTVNVPIGANTEFQITPMFIERPAAATITYRFTVELNGISVPKNYTIGLRATNDNNLGGTSDFNVTIANGETLENTDRTITNASGTASFTASYQAINIPSGFTVDLDPTSLVVPEYIPPITPLVFNGRVNAVYSFSNGSLLCGGQFTQYGTTSANAIVKLNANGTIDTSFNYGTGFSTDESPLNVNMIAVQNDGKIICVGRFNAYQGNTAQSIIRLNANGSRDTSFSSGTGFRRGSSTTNADAIRILTNGKLVVGGNYNDYNGTTRNSIAVLNANGSLDTSFDPAEGLTSGGNVIGVRTIELDSSNRILVGGDFTHARNVSSNRIAKFNVNGTLDTSFTVGTGFAGGHSVAAVYSIKRQGNQFYVGGQFGTYNGSTYHRIVRLNANGSADTTFSTGVAFQDTAGSVFTFSIDAMGDIYCGGSFVKYQNVTTNRIVKISSSGSRDSSFAIGTGFDDSVFSLQIEDSGVILATGDFSTYKGVTVGEIVRLNQSGTPL